mmetsp:Transcript_10155/g.17382  ORF Transcript_10155/g.17382 Transcript_10155/m.17382 type:complete len:277 (+) Transcript_10155:784-1614(+)
MMRATMPRSLVMRCSRRWISNSFSVLSLVWICALSCSTRCSTAASCSPVETSTSLLFETTTLVARPRSATVAFDAESASSLVINLAPVKQQMSSRKARRTSPKPGALTTQTSTTPRFLLSVRPEIASPVTSGAMMRSGSCDATTPSRTLRTSFITESFSSVTRMRGESCVVVWLSWSFTNAELIQPTSCSMPSVYSTVSASSLPTSSTVEPSPPTRNTASATRAPISSEPVEIVAIDSYCSIVLTGVAASRIFSTKKDAAFTSPRCIATELCPFEM